MPSNEFRRLKESGRGREGKREREEQGEDKGGTEGRQKELVYRNKSNAWNSFILIPSRSDFWLLFRSQKNGHELVTSIFQSYF